MEGLQSRHEHSDLENPNDVHVREAFSLRRESRSAISIWGRRLEELEIERLRLGTGDVAVEFYSGGERSRATVQSGGRNR